MSRSGAFVRVECDFCEGITDEIELTLLAQKNAWDERNVDAALKRKGWEKSGDLDICDLCVERREEEKS